MVATGPKADIWLQRNNGRDGPIATFCSAKNSGLFAVSATVKYVTNQMPLAAAALSNYVAGNGSCTANWVPHEDQLSFYHIAARLHIRCGVGAPGIDGQTRESLDPQSGHGRRSFG